jgi:hypothetical protein
MRRKSDGHVYTPHSLGLYGTCAELLSATVRGIWEQTGETCFQSNSCDQRCSERLFALNSYRFRRLIVEVEGHV